MGGNKIQKPIYNHVNGTLDAPEEITPTQIVIVEGLHPMADPRVRELLDFSLYLDITTTSSSPGRSSATWSSAATPSSRSSSRSRRASPTSTRSSRRSAATPTS